MIHQIRNSTKYVSYKDLKALMVDLKAVYAAVDEPSALEALNVFSGAGTRSIPRLRLLAGKLAESESIFQVSSGSTPTDLHNKRH